MFDAQTFTLFLATACVLVLSPGPDTVLIVSRTIASGTLAGWMTLLGTQAGNVVHAVLRASACPRSSCSSRSRSRP